MPWLMRNFVEGEYYHVILRRVGDEDMFLDESDYYRGLISLYEFNNNRSVKLSRIRSEKKKENKTTQNKSSIKFKRKKLVELVAFCFMPNHIHLLLTPLADKGLTLFMSKFGSGYPVYFKNKYNIKRKGYFFQGRFHSIHIESDAQMRVLLSYIHLNPLSLVFPGWKKGKKFNSETALDYCVNYKWSSLKDYLGEKNFPSVTDRKFASEILGHPKRQIEELKDWLENAKVIYNKHEDTLT